jgi:hypothetical protein
MKKLLLLTGIFFWVTMVFSQQEMITQEEFSMKKNGETSNVQGVNLEPNEGTHYLTPPSYKQAAFDKGRAGFGYAWNVFSNATNIPTGPVRVSLSNGAVMSIKNVPTSEIWMSGADMVEDKWYAVNGGTTNSGLYTVNTTTGDHELIGYTGFAFSGLAYDSYSGVLYGSMNLSTFSRLYSIDVNTAQAKTVGFLGMFSMFGIAANHSGIIYGINSSSNLVSINPQNGQATVIGPLGITITSAQDIAYDRDNNTLYGTLYSGNTGGLYTIDVNTGQATLIFNFIAELAGFSVPYSLANEGAPAALNDFSAIAGAEGALEATLSWTNPSLTIDGFNLTQIDSVVILKNAQLTAIFNDPLVGQSETYTDTTYAIGGSYTYRAFAVNEQGAGVKTNYFLFVGEDVPAAPDNLTLTAQDDYGLLSWDAPSQGLNGGYLSGENITYTIVRLPQQTTVATDITETEFLDTTLPGIGNYWYSITAKNHKGTGGMATTGLELLVGGEYLMYETFTYQAGLAPPFWYQTGTAHKWSLYTGNDAGGITPQLLVHWDPPANGVSRLVSYPIETQGHSSLRYRFKNFFLNATNGYGNERLAADVSWDNGDTFVQLWDTLVGTSNIPANTLELFIDVPEGEESMQVAFRFEGNSQFINWWSIDDLTIEPWFVDDLKAVNISGTNTPGANQENIYTVRIENYGSSLQQAYTVRLFKDDAMEIGSLAGISIEPGEMLEYEFSWTPDPDDAGASVIYAVVDFEDDENESNNQTPDFNLTVQPEDIVAVSIGDGAVLQGLPFSFQFHNSLSQTLYFPSEIGMQGGAISGIKYFNHFDMSLLNRVVKVYLGETEATDLSGGWVDPTSLQLVFDGTVDFPMGENDIYIHFDTTYNYQGGNLVVYSYKQDVEWSQVRNFYSSDAQGTKRSRRAARYSTPYNPLAPEQPGTIINYYPNTVFFIDGSGKGSIEGTISEGEDPVSNVNVRVLETQLSATSEEDGNYSLPYVLPGTYNLEFEKLGYYTNLVNNIVVEPDETTVVDVSMTKLPMVSVSGFVSGSDLPAIGLDSALVTMTGYFNYEVYTDENGQFIIEDVFGDKTYDITIFHKRFILYEGIAEVGTENTDLGNIILQENPLPVQNVVAIEMEEGALITWQQPELYPEGEFRYDDGEEVGRLGFSTGTLNSVMGSAHHNIAELYEMKWKLVHPDFQHATVKVWVLGLTPEGLPNRSQVLYSASNIPNTPFQWTTHVFPDTLSAPNGFFVGVSATGNLGLGMDDGQGPLWPFVGGRQFGISNITNASTPFTPVENWNYPYNFLIRAVGKDFGEIDFGNKALTHQQSNEAAPIFEFMSSSEAGFPSATDFGKKSVNDNKSKALETFSVYRLLEEDFFEEENWTEVATQINAWEFVDNDWPELIEGAYIFAVVAHYANGVNSPFSFSNMLPKDMFVTYTVNVTTNSGDNPEGAILKLVNQSGNEDHVYTATAGADGTAVFNGVWRGTYTLTVQLPGYDTFTAEDLAIDDHGLSFDAELTEIIATPFGLIVETENQNTGDARFTWRVNQELFEGFEGEFLPHGWKKLNPDGGAGWMQLGANTTPLPGWTGGVAFPAPGGGNQMAFVTYIHGGTSYNDQWLVTPELIAVEDFEFSFFIRKHPLNYIDNLDVRISTTVQDDPEAFDILVQTLTFPTGTPDDWVKHTFDLSDFVEQGTSFYIAFREHVEDNLTQGSGIFLDNVHYGPQGRSIAQSINPVKECNEEIGRDLSGNYYYGPAPKNVKAFLGYNIFLNNLTNPVATGIMEEEFLFTNLSEGEHVAGVQSVFTTGSSAIVATDFSIVFPPPEYRLTFDVIDQDGTTITDARITLEGIQYNPGVYVFGGLLAGNYEYSVNREGFIIFSGTAVIVDQDVTLAVVLEEKTYSINASAGTNGSINPSGTVTVTHGTNQSFTITPNTGYSIANVLVDGVSIGAVSNYTFTNVTANHVITASFVINTYTITASAGANGSINPSGTVTVNHGASQSYSFTPNTGYSIADVLVDGVSVGNTETYEFTNILANHTIHVDFVLIIGIEELDNYFLKVNVYPVPARDALNIQVSHNNDIEGNLAYTLTDYKGRTIMDGYLFSDHTSLEVSGLPAGYYLITLKMDQRIIKVIKFSKEN